MSDAVIVGAVRTPIGAFGGYGLNVHAADLGATAIKAALERARLDPTAVEEVLMGCVLQAGLGMNVARQSALRPASRHRSPRSRSTRCAVLG